MGEIAPENVTRVRHRACSPRESVGHRVAGGCIPGRPARIERCRIHEARQRLGAGTTRQRFRAHEVRRSERHQQDHRSVLANTDARKVLEQPHRETSIFSTSPEGVPVRARFDIYGNTAGADLKTTADASPRGFNHHVVEFGYFVQHAWYDDVHFFETGERLDSFSFIAVQTTGPYHVAVYPLDVMYLEIGRKLHEKHATCISDASLSRETRGRGIEGDTCSHRPNWLVYEHEEQVTF
ncbi:PD-(D/E)XK nuclease-like domain-containing protein [Microbacterium sp. LWH12-1.2]|uniref:PD-(D/E)XK nuclease-like domain-containing protein n=1 Tax=Microbacterium sp. LWH12-1.2 TaxID=3135259 RepID=UPI00343C4BC6